MRTEDAKARVVVSESFIFNTRKILGSTFDVISEPGLKNRTDE